MAIMTNVKITMQRTFITPNPEAKAALEADLARFDLTIEEFCRLARADELPNWDLKMTWFMTRDELEECGY